MTAAHARCTAYQFENPPGMRFCGGCAVALATVCPQCAGDVPAGFRLCGHCGASQGVTPGRAAPHPPSR